MCGIAGFVDFQEDVRNKTRVAQNMAKTLTPRGPDAGGFYEDTQISFVHRRLIVVDPENGAQPMISTDGNFILIYNGELYNTQDIKNELLQNGHEFKGHSDTEVLLHAFMQWGAQACLQRLNGIYAFAVWEKKEHRLTLARDRLGVKPLFYSRTQHGIVFGSELKALFCHPAVKPLLDENGLRSILLLGPARTPGDGVFKDVEEVLPGQYLTLSPEGMQKALYWTLTAKQHTDSPQDTIAHTRFLVEDAATRQLVSDVPLCTFLSGGLDSSILSMLAARTYQQQNKAPLHTWSVDYQDNAQYFTKSVFQPNTDSEYIDYMVHAIGSEHQNVVIDNAALCAALLAATDARDLPGMADVDSSLLLFCAQVKKQFTVCLSGECADEIFGGYPWYHRQEILFEDTFPWSRSIDLRLGLLRDGVVTDGADFVRSRYLATCAEAPKLDGEDKVAARRREMFLLNLRWFMATLLDRKDRMSMYSGLEVRVPFCDHRIVEYAYNMPWELKSWEGREKGILRKAFETDLPEEIVWRKKSPYPKTFHPAYTQLTAGYVRQIFRDEHSIAASLFNQTRILELIESPESLTEPWYGQLMRTPQIFAYIIQLDRWFKKYHIDLVS